MSHITKLSSGHQLQSAHEVVNHELVIAGEPLSKRVQEAGGTPCYMYDMTRAQQQITAVREAFPKQFSVFYAVKANPNSQVLAALQPWVDGLDVASYGEVETAMNVGYKPQDMGFAGPAKSQGELNASLENGVFLSLESITEAKRICTWAEQHQKPIEVGIRINPSFELRASGMHMGGGAQVFGIDEETLFKVVETINQSAWVSVTGLHIYAGSQCLQMPALVEQFRETFLCFSRVCEQFELPIKRLNFGGGLGVPYFAGNVPIDLALLGHALHELCAEFKDFIQHKELIVELGRFLMADAGLYVSQVSDVKVSRKHTFVMTNGGMHHHLANSGNLGQLLKKNYPVVLGQKVDCPVEQKVTIAGPLCTPLDVLAKNIELPQVDIDDFVVIMLSGAYGLSSSPQQFLSHPSAKELVIPVI